jgi:hypothetical protein
VYADLGQALRTVHRCEARAKAEAVADRAEAAANRTQPKGPARITPENGSYREQNIGVPGLRVAGFYTLSTHERTRMSRLSGERRFNSWRMKDVWRARV